MPDPIDADPTDARWRRIARQTRDPQLRADILRMLDGAGSGRVPVRGEPSKGAGDEV